MPDLHISSVSNPRVKALVSLHRRRERDRSGVTLVEGLDELRIALDAGARPRELYGCPELMTDPDEWPRLIARIRQLPPVGAESEPGAGSEPVLVASTTSAVFAKVAYRDHPDGVLAVVDRPGVRLDELSTGTDPLLVVCESVEKPGNLGAILRTADAAGADAVLAADPVTDWGNPNVIRASKGTVFSVPVVSAPVDRVLDRLRRDGVRIVAATPVGEFAHTGVDLRGPLAIALGAEHRGLSADLSEAADLRVRIPMKGRVNSLNVSASAAVLLYEALRQRDRSG